jgi:circadian clock protein KaiC
MLDVAPVLFQNETTATPPAPGGFEQERRRSTMEDQPRDTRGSRAGSGIAGLDDILGGGFPAARIHLVKGMTGVGKTTMGMQFLLEGRDRCERCLLVSLAETVQELESIAAAHEWSLDGIEVLELTSAEFLDAAADNSIFRADEVELLEASAVLLERIREFRPHRLVLDSVTEFKLFAGDPLRFRRALWTLRRELQERRCTALLLDSRTETLDEDQVHSLIHGIVRLERREMSYGGDRRGLRVVKMRGQGFREGAHDFKIVRGGVRVFPRLVAAEQRVEPSSQSAVAVPLLEDLLAEGGLDAGSTILVQGPAGSGKSTIVLEFLVAAARQGRRAVLYTFEESVRTLLPRGEGLGLALDEVLEQGLLRIQQVDPSELSPGEFANAVREAMEAGGAEFIALDSVNGYLQAMPDERFLLLHLHELSSYIGRRGGIFTVTLDRGAEKAATVRREPSFLADTVLLMRHFEQEGRVRQALSVFKRRGGPHDRSFRELQLVPGSGVRLGGVIDFTGGSTVTVHETEDDEGR